MITYNVILVLVGIFLLGITNGILGCFVFLRKQSLLGDVVSHSALPGIIIAFLLLKSNAPLVLLLGATTSGILSILLVYHITHYSTISVDSAFGIVLSFFLGIGIVLLSRLSEIKIPGKQAIDSYLFGMASTMLPINVLVISVICFVVMGLVFFFWKEFKTLIFDKDYTESLGFSARFLEIFILILIVLIVCVSLESVGIILTASLLVTPAATARQLSKKFNQMVFISALVGGTSCLLGTLVSVYYVHFSTGPTIVLVATFFFILSLLFSSSNGGIVTTLYQFYKQKKDISIKKILLIFIQLAKNHDDPTYTHVYSTIKAKVPLGYNLKRGLSLLNSLGYIYKDYENKWGLTAQGIEKISKDFNIAINKTKK